MCVSTQLANLLGYEQPKQLVKTEFTKFMAQPFMQLHGRWMKVGVATMLLLLRDLWGSG
jgi:hypothetical protein